MNPLTQFKKTPLLPLLIALALVLRAAPAAAQANEVTNWNRIATETLVLFPAAAGGAPVALQINMGMTQGAVYDAVNAIEPRYLPYLLETRFDPSASKEAATATAAYRVLFNIVSTVPASIPFPNRASLLQTLATEYANSLALIPDGPPKTVGIAAGNAAADAMIAARQNDGRFGPSPWVPNYDPGHWRPLLNPDGSPMLDPTAWVANVRPFLMQSSSQFRTDGPNALTSTAYAEDFNEVKALGSLNSTTRTPEQTHNAIFWQSAGGGAFLWGGVARNLIADPQYGVDIVDSALLFAMMNLSAADAAINCWNDKYYWDFWRPWTAIQRADEDGNPDTEPDPSWTALLTAPYPENPSGHLCGDSAHLEVLQMFFGTDKIRFGVTSSRSRAKGATSTGSRKLSRKSSTPASGRACTSALRTYRRRFSAGRWSITWRRTTSNRSIDTDEGHRFQTNTEIQTVPAGVLAKPLGRAFQNSRLGMACAPLRTLMRLSQGAI